VNELYGIEDFTGMIADETIAEDPETMAGFLNEKKHPVLAMEPLL
jgi:acetyl-CoA synthase